MAIQVTQVPVNTVVGDGILELKHTVAEAGVSRNLDTCTLPATEVDPVHSQNTPGINDIWPSTTLSAWSDIASPVGRRV